MHSVPRLPLHTSHVCVLPRVLSHCAVTHPTAHCRDPLSARHAISQPKHDYVFTRSGN